MILVHRAGQTHVIDTVPIPPLSEVIKLYEAVAYAGGAFAPTKVVGIALNTRHLDETAAKEAIAQTIGEQPRTVMATNLEALVAGLPLPYAQAGGQVSKFEAPLAPSSGADDPRLHGSQVVD